MCIHARDSFIGMRGDGCGYELVKKVSGEGEPTIGGSGGECLDVELILSSCYLRGVGW